MNFPIPPNLCRNLNSAKVGDIVHLSERGESIFRLVTHVTPTTVVISNGGGLGTKRPFRKRDGSEIGGSEYHPGLIVSFGSGDAHYVAVARASLRPALVTSIVNYARRPSLSFAALEEAAAHLGVPELALLPPY